MARFNLDDYETVESRIKRFTEAYPDGRIVTKWVNQYDKRNESGVWVVKASVYLTAGDQANKLPKATGYATETEGSGGANNVDAMANCETSAIGRALANMAMSGNKRSSREEMQKVERLSRDWTGEATKLTDVDALRLLWAEAKAAGVNETTLNQIKELASGHSEGKHSGDSGSPAPSKAKQSAK